MALGGTLIQKANKSIRFLLVLSITLFISVFIIITTEIDNRVFATSTPVITSITPSSGSNAGGDAVTIIGNNFSSDATVTFNGTAATVQNISTDGTTITVTSPSVTITGDAEVRATNSDGGFARTFFTYTGVTRTITGINHTRGPIAGGQTVTVNGSGFYLQFSKLSTGSEASHECGISASKVYCWGNNNYGQLGDSTTTNRSVPTAVVTAGTPMDGKSIIDVATGESFTVALASDSTMYTWGYNGTGALGNNSNTNSTVPVAVIASGVLNGKTITKVAAGEYHSVALASDGTVYAWGNNGYGQLGNNTTTTSYAPVAVITTGALSGKTIIQVTAGNYYTVALASDGTVYAWGNNGYGQLGDGTTTSHYVPTAVTTAGTPMDGKNIVNIASGRIYSVALASDGTAYSWGDNTYGELGNGNRGSPAIYTAQSNVPVAVITTGALSGKTIVQVAAGYYNTVALASDGTIYSWGYGGQGELGNNTSADSSVPVAVITTGVLSGKTITQVAAISWNSLVLSSDGTVYGWGRNSYGVLATNSGVPVATAGKPLPLDVTFGGNAVTVFNQTNNSFQFITPAHNVGFVDMDIAATDYTAAAHASNIYEYVLPPVINSINPNTGYTTGGDSVTILGKNFSSDNIITFNGLPATITNVSYDGDSITVTTPSHYAGNVDVVVSDILGQKSTFKNGFTYIEDSPTVTSISPTYGPEKGSQSVTINGTNFIKKYKFTSFANGSAAYHTCGIDDGKVYCWGLNDHGQIGDGTGTSQASPVAVTTSGVLAGKTITQVAVGIYHTVALASDGTVYTWGNNEYGQLGNNTTTSSNVPVAVTTTGALSGKTIIQVAAGYEHTVALASDGTVYTWGLNNYGQLGNGTTGSSSTPIAVVAAGTPMDGKNIVDVSVGQYHTAALSSDGTVYAWGYNNYGQLGNNSTTNSSIPVAVTSTGVLSGKTIIQVATGYYHTVVLASDGTVYA